MINVELPEDIAGVYPAAAAAAQLQQQQNQYNIPQAAEAVLAAIQDSEDDGNGGVSGEDTESDAAASEDSESDSDYDPNEDPSDEEAEALPSKRTRKQALETLKKANEQERIEQNRERQLPARSNRGHTTRYGEHLMAQVIEEAPINDTDHVIDPELIAQNPDEVAI